MQPIGPLMHEHRLIERMIDLIRRQAETIQRGNEPDSEFISGAVEFFRVYADRCHHGKEEELLFRALEDKKISTDLSAILKELIQEHKLGRSLVVNLSQANQAHMHKGDDFGPLVTLLNELCSFYPKHIEKEDKHFFFPIMDFFTREEMDHMLKEFEEFDRQLIHEFFHQRVEHLEGRS